MIWEQKMKQKNKNSSKGYEHKNKAIGKRMQDRRTRFREHSQRVDEEVGMDSRQSKGGVRAWAKKHRTPCSPAQLTRLGTQTIPQGIQHEIQLSKEEACDSSRSFLIKEWQVGSKLIAYSMQHIAHMLH